MLRRLLLFVTLLLIALAGGGVAVARGTPSLNASGPTSVSGTEESAVFQIADRTVRQIRYADGATLRYTFRVTNDGRLPVRVLGLDPEQPDTRLFTFTDLTPIEIPAGKTSEVTLSLAMGGCERLSSRAGSFVPEVAVRTEQAGLFEDVVTLTLPEEVHTSSPREAFCPNSTATSRPAG
ncbi:MAG: hypothetical protein WKF79_12455 [Nocardioides sp.]